MVSFAFQERPKRRPNLCREGFGKRPTSDEVGTAVEEKPDQNRVPVEQNVRKGNAGNLGTVIQKNLHEFHISQGHSFDQGVVLYFLTRIISS